MLSIIYIAAHYKDFTGGGYKKSHALDADAAKRL